VFRGKVFQPTLSGNSYRIFIEGLKSPVTKAAYSFALQKYMNHLKICNPDELLIHQENPKIVQDQIIEYLIQLKNPPHSLRFVTRSQYLAAIMTFYDLNEVVLNKKKIYRYLGEEERPIENRYRDIAFSPDGRTIFVITDSSGPAQAIDGGVTDDLWNPGSLLVFRYQDNMTSQ
jgi:hypothetical protein